MVSFIDTDLENLIEEKAKKRKRDSSVLYVPTILIGGFAEWYLLINWRYVHMIQVSLSPLFSFRIIW